MDATVCEDDVKLLKDLLENPSTPSKSDAEGFFIKNKDCADFFYNPYEYHTFRIKCDSVNILKEEINNSDNLVEEKEQSEEVTRNEVNGISEPDNLESSSENITENVAANEALSLEKEETTTNETNAAVESGKKENEENLEDNQEHEFTKEVEEKEKLSKVVENPKDDEVENLFEEKPPLSEEYKLVDNIGSKEKVAGADEEDNDNESPGSEKSQDE